MLPPIDSPRYKNHLVGYIAFVCSIPVYIFLIYIVWTTKSLLLKQYQKVLILNIIVDVFYIVINAFFFTDHLILKTDDGLQYFIFVTGIINYPSVFLTWIISGFTTLSVYLMIGSLPVNFIYSYFFICRGHQLKKHEFSVLVALSLIIPFIIVIRHLIMFFPKESNEHFREYFSNSHFIYDNATIVTFIADPGYTSTPSIIIGLTVVTISYFVVIGTLFAIILTMKRFTQNGNFQIRRLQIEIICVLIIQSLSPFFGFGLPLYVLYFQAAFGNLPPSNSYFSVCSHWSPFVNAVFTMIFIGTYRRRISKILFCQELKGVPAPAIIHIRTNFPRLSAVEPEQPSRLF